ncbi:helix-turn-helix domain-containing protein [Streptomyces flavofungini]|uniref:helix-turn-helix domain-containing protein n=1 Tax=Streptomyces flavofungini TaxID=68200 RepID=UPI0025AF1E83|nr:helix-turn-helix transcriptional regulator [Streptomyces flavofungini]WJV48883.1 helix-turn-helix transcriptional regulator [Streptomyces flavofungini]
MASYDTLVPDLHRRGATLSSRPRHPQPTVRRRRLGSELKRLREAAKISMDQAAERIGGDKSKISRQENGRQGVTKLEIEALLDLYRVSDSKLKTALVTLAREGRRKNWWAPFSDILDERFQEHLSIEADAGRMLLFQPLLVPGLLQTREYAEVSIRGDEDSHSDEQVESHVSVRMGRQEILQRDSPPQLVCILDEAVIRRVVGSPKVMADQLRKLIEVNNPPRLSIQIIPFSQGCHAGLDGAFSVYSYPDPMDLDVVSLGYLDGLIYLEEDGPVERYKLAFDQLRSSALPSRQSMDLIAKAARSLTS